MKARISDLAIFLAVTSGALAEGPEEVVRRVAKSEPSIWRFVRTADLALADVDEKSYEIEYVKELERRGFPVEWSERTIRIGVEKRPFKGLESIECEYALEAELDKEGGRILGYLPLVVLHARSEE